MEDAVVVVVQAVSVVVLDGGGMGVVRELVYGAIGAHDVLVRVADAGDGDARLV